MQKMNAGVVGLCLAALLALWTNSAQARQVSLQSGKVTFEVPDDYRELPQMPDSALIYCAVNDSVTFALLNISSGNLDYSKVLDRMDSAMCDLTKFELVDTEKDFFLNFTNDYVLRKYTSESGRKFASFTRYTMNNAYCFGLWYDSEEEFEAFRKTTKSVHFAQEEGFEQVPLALSYSGWWIALLCLFVALSSYVAAASNNVGQFWSSLRQAIVSTLIIGALSVFPLWSYWYALLVLLIVTFVLDFFCAITGCYFEAD